MTVWKPRRRRGLDAFKTERAVASALGGQSGFQGCSRLGKDHRRGESRLFVRFVLFVFLFEGAPLAVPQYPAAEVAEVAAGSRSPPPSTTQNESKWLRLEWLPVLPTLISRP